MAWDGTAVQRKPQCILVGRIKHMTPQLAVQHTTTRLTILLRQVDAEGLLLRSLCFIRPPEAVNDNKYWGGAGGSDVDVDSRMFEAKQPIINNCRAITEQQ